MALSGADSTRLLSTLQRLLEIPAGDLKTALTHAADAIADALRADKVDAFLYDAARDSLVARGVSMQPLSALQRSLGLDVLPLANGGRMVEAYRTGKTFRSGALRSDPAELLGVRESLKVESVVAIPLYVGTRLRGVLAAASLERGHFSDADQAFGESAVRWVGVVAHRSELIAEMERNAVEQGRRAAAEEVVTVLAHDLRDYIAPVSMRLHLLRHRAESEGRTDDASHAAAALRGISSLGALIGSLLDVARIDRGLFSLDLEPLDLASLAREAAALLSNGDHPVVVSSPAPVIVMADPARLRQCLQNLIGNAINHSPANASVNIFISRVRDLDRAWGQAEIIDEGPGIAAELLPRIFDRFVSGREKEGGLGIGLYFAKRVAVAHGGDLTAHGGEGRGARFVLRIPADSANGDPMGDGD